MRNKKPIASEDQPKELKEPTTSAKACLKNVLFKAAFQGFGELQAQHAFPMVVEGSGTTGGPDPSSPGQIGTILNQ